MLKQVLYWFYINLDTKNEGEGNPVLNYIVNIVRHYLGYIAKRLIKYCVYEMLIYLLRV